MIRTPIVVLYLYYDINILLPCIEKQIVWTTRIKKEIDIDRLALIERERVQKNVQLGH